VPVDGSLAMPVPDPVEIRRWQSERLKQFSIELFPGMKPTLLVENGDPGRAVRDNVRRNGADLVMLPTHGRGAFRRFLLGSVTTKILHDVDCAVWTDAHHAETQPAFPYRRVVCALDVNSDEAAAVLRAACSVARVYEADLMLLNVVRVPPTAWEVDYAEYRQALLDNADAKMRLLRQETGIRAPYEIVGANRPAEELRRIAAERNADLIVTGRGHSQGGLGRVESQLYQIIREAPCPVLSI
jgi:nucleotide-binding universal stress UspA family protein